MSKAKKEAVRESMKRAARSSKSAESEIEALAAKADYSNLSEPAAPKWRRFKTNDATVEKLGELLAANPRGLLVFRDELIRLLSQWDRDVPDDPNRRHSAEISQNIVRF